MIGAPGALMVPKAKVGVSLDGEILREVDAIVESCKHMNISRSQVIESILARQFVAKCFALTFTCKNADRLRQYGGT